MSGKLQPVIGLMVFPGVTMQLMLAGGFFIMHIDSGILIADIFGFIISLLIAPFLAFWMSAVKSRVAVIIGAILGGIIGFLILLFWAGNINPPASPAAVFFGSALFCSAAGLVGGIAVDLLVGRLNSRDYRRTTSHEA